MSWASHPTTEMPSPLVSPGGRHRGRGRGVVAALLLMGLISVVVVGALFGPGLVGRPAQATPGPAPVAPAPSGPAESAVDIPTAAVTDARTSPATATSTSSTSDTSTLEAAVFSLTNAERASHNCPALVLDPRLAAAARAHSADMARTGWFGHTAPDGTGPADRMRLAGYDTRSGWAENIAHGQNTASAVMAAWMASEGHRANILNCDLKGIGVGAARGANSRLYWTQDFGGAA